MHLYIYIVCKYIIRTDVYIYIYKYILWRYENTVCAHINHIHIIHIYICYIYIICYVSTIDIPYKIYVLLHVTYHVHIYIHKYSNVYIYIYIYVIYNIYIIYIYIWHQNICEDISDISIYYMYTLYMGTYIHINIIHICICFYDIYIYIHTLHTYTYVIWAYTHECKYIYTCI